MWGKEVGKGGEGDKSVGYLILLLIYMSGELRLRGQEECLGEYSILGPARLEPSHRKELVFEGCQLTLNYGHMSDRRIVSLGPFKDKA